VKMDQVEASLHDASVGSTWFENLQKGLDAGKGVIVATAHFGSWDMAGALAAQRFSMSAVAEIIGDPQLNRLLQGHRQGLGVKIIPMEGSARRILRALQENTLVAIVVDRPMTRETGVEISFFGHKTYVQGGPAALALKSGAAIVPGYVWYEEKGRFGVRAFEPIFPRPVQGAEARTLEIARLTQAIYTAQEEIIRANPTQWYMFRPFWPDNRLEDETAAEQIESAGNDTEPIHNTEPEIVRSQEKA
jgi:KDO2-lipid IV(A) lauroyltransferase